MNKNIKNLTFFFLFLFLILIIMNTYWSMLKEKELESLSENPRNIEDISLRGGIISATGEYLAKSIEKNNKFIRFYPEADLTGNITGYLDPVLGKTCLEYSNDNILKSKDYPFSISGFLDKWEDFYPKGYNLHLTIDMELTRVAYKALGSNRGAIVAIKPSTGEIMVLVSKPGFDPNLISQTWKSLNLDPASPLLDRSLQGLYPPGSIFKVFVLASAIEEGLIRETDILNCPGYIEVDGNSFHCSHPHGQQSPREALANSCNVAFAEIGLELGKEKMLDYFNRFFNKSFDFPLPVAYTELKEENLITRSYLAQTSFGQGELLLNPLEACLLASTIGNDGVMMKPYLIKEITDSKNKVVKKFKPYILSKFFSKSTAELTGSFMKTVVEDGTGYRAYLEGISVAGKTGTAENGKGISHAWFICFAPVENPEIAISVLIEEGGYGGDFAAPVAREIILKALR